MSNKSPSIFNDVEMETLPQRKKPRLITLLHVCVLILITSLVFSNSLENAYHLDSFHRVKSNTEINKFWPPARFFTDLRTGSTVPQIAEYRPMMPLSHAVNSEIARATGTTKLKGFHIGNIAIHISTTILVYFLFCLLISNWSKTRESETQTVHYSHQAFAAALIFSVHPIAGSAVNYIAARDLLLMVFFFVAFMLTYFSMRRKGDTASGWLISLLLLSLAILSKQVAIVGFGMVFLFEWILADSKLRDWQLWARTALFSVPTAAFFLLRWLWITKQNTEDTIRVPVDILYPLTMAKAHVFYYLKNFIWPFEMRALAKFNMVDSFIDPGALAGLLFIITTLVIAWLLHKRNPLISFAILAYWLLFALTASIFPFRYVVTDYRQYLPFIFLSLIISLLCFSLRSRAIPAILLTGMTLYFSVASYQINQHWKTEETFYKQSVKYGAVALAHQNYGLAIVGKNPELAEYHYLEAIRQNPFHIYANINLGLLHIRMGKEDEGLKRLYGVANLNPKWALSHYWLSVGLKKTGKKEASLKELQRAADLDPRSLDYQYKTALALQSAGKHSEAFPYLERVSNLNPEYKLTGFWLGYALQKTGQSQKAIETYIHFLKKNPKHVQSHFNLAYELMAKNNCETAVEHFNKVLALRPAYREAHLQLSRCYKTLGDESLAEKHSAIYKKGG